MATHRQVGVFPVSRASFKGSGKGHMDTQAIYRRRWLILSVLIVGLLAIVIDNTVLNVALKTIAEPRGGLGASQSQLEWAINSYTLVFAGLLFTFGVIGDKIGRKRMLIIGLGLFGVASLLSAYSRSPEQLIFARAAMGLGGAAVMPQTLSIISNVFEPAERPRAIGLWAMAVGIGIATGPVLGGVLLDHFWWGSVFLINVPVTVIGAVAAAILVPESRNANAGKIDYVGVLLSIAGLVTLVYGIVQGGDNGAWLSLGVLGPVVGGLVILAAFAWYESRISHPSLDVRLFRDRRLSASIGALGLVFFGMGGVFFFTSFYLQNVRGYSPLDAGLLTVPFAVGQLLLAPRSAALVRRQGRGRDGPVRHGRRPGRVRDARDHHADLGARRALPGPGRGDRRHHAGRHLGRHGRAAAGAGGRGLRAHQHRTAGGGRAQRRHPRLGPGRVLPEQAQPVADPPTGRGADGSAGLDHRDPGGRPAARLGRTVAAGSRERRVRARHALHLADRGTARAGGRVRGAALDARQAAKGRAGQRWRV
jgi:MFS family permease